MLQLRRLVPALAKKNQKGRYPATTVLNDVNPVLALPKQQNRKGIRPFFSCRTATRKELAWLAMRTLSPSVITLFTPSTAWAG
ncbi:hypothetical protein MACH24_03630 [Erythrobacter sp. Dej080120_24]|nr:hypothetical protein MACH24_03630 [Erythrobacter sp. Dej080120_24]